MTVVVCSFSGDVMRLKRRDLDDERAVLHAFRSGSGRFSVWDASETPLGWTVNRLKRNGFITIELSDGFPWSRAIVTDAGAAFLDGVLP